MAEATNILLLFAEASVYFAAMATIFRFRSRFGVGAFFCALGTMHFLETYLAAILYFQVAPGIALSPGSTVLFSGKLVMLLLLYIREDVATVRQPIWGLLFGNFLMVALVYLMRFHEVMPAGERLPDFPFMGAMGGLMIWGSILLFIDSILVILLYERSAGWFGERQTPRIIFSAAVVLSFDQIGFFLVLHYVIGVPWDVLYGGWMAKVVAAVFYGTLTGLYLRYVDTTHRLETQPRLGDLLDTLTYRERYEALLRKTGRDSLTGLFDRGRFDVDGGEAVAHAMATGRPLSLLVIDIDHFKKLNDRHGHLVGDEALKRIASAIAATTREADQVFRYGGEEFVVVARGLAHGQAMIAAERLRRQIAATPIGDDRGVTASIGVATLPQDGATLTELFKAADKRLYAAKAAGRDRIFGRIEEPRDARTGPDIRRPA